MIGSTILTMALILSANLAQSTPLEPIGNPGEETLAQRLTAIYLENHVREGSFGSSGVPASPPRFQVDPRQFAGFRESFSLTPSGSLPGLPLPLLTPASLPPGAPGNPSDRLLSRACNYLKTPYRRGGSLQTGRATDCSGFVQYIYKKSNIDLPRASAEQARVGKVAAQTMDFSKLLAGDLLFFRRGGRHIGHVGIYLGEGKMIHASSRRRGVIITDLRQSYYQGTFVVAKRVLEAGRRQ
jgi:hypothetical protein